jgi:hypothetical protein
VTASAQDVPAREEWRLLQTYVAPTAKGASDLDTPFLGMTGAADRVHRSQIGALSFGSRIVVEYKLDADEIFKLFQTQDPSRLLGICSPASLATPDYVRAVLAHLETNPDDLKRPIAEVFYEALGEAYPCN